MATLTDRRNVYPSREIPHLWAHGLPKGREIRGQGNIFAHGDTIYSYGLHFPMARRIVAPDGTVVFLVNPSRYLVNPSRYSVTTGKHQGWVRQAIPIGVAIVECCPSIWRNIERGEWRPVVDEYTKAIQIILRGIKPRNKPHTNDRILVEASAKVEDWKRLHSLFKFRCRVDRVKMLGTLLEDAVEASWRAQKAQAEKAKRDKAKRERLLSRCEKTSLPAWRNHQPMPENAPSIESLPYPAIRLDATRPDTVETSQGARLPMGIVRSIIDAIPAAFAALNAHFATRTNIPDIYAGPYGAVYVESYGVVIGCHRIPWKECRAFMAHAGIVAPNGFPSP